MSNPILFVGGMKGGVGKSMMTIAAIDYYLHRELPEPVVLIESDTANPDVGKIYDSVPGVQQVLADLDAEAGWLGLVDCIAGHHGPVVINSAARNGAGLREYGHLLTAASQEMRRELVMIWPVNRQRDSLQLLAEARGTFGGHVCVVRNLYFGSADKFELYNASNLREDIEASGGATLDLPELHDRIADRMCCARMSLDALAQENMGTKLAIRVWREKVERIMAEIVKPRAPDPAQPIAAPPSAQSPTPEWPEWADGSDMRPGETQAAYGRRKRLEGSPETRAAARSKFIGES